MNTIVMIALSRSYRAPGDNLPRVLIGYRVHVDEVLKRYSIDRIQVIHCIISYQTMCPRKLELKHRAIRLRQQFEHLPIVVGAACSKLLTHPEGDLACIIDLYSDQRVLCHH